MNDRQIDGFILLRQWISGVGNSTSIWKRVSRMCQLQATRLIGENSQDKIESGLILSIAAQGVAFGADYGRKIDGDNVCMKGYPRVLLGLWPL